MPRFDLADYVDVQTRIRQFWSDNPDGRIDTNMVTLPGEFDQVVFVATIYKQRDNPFPSATGWAAEQAGPSGPNQTSWHENCETSAIGRALANMGYATSQRDRPSREEMAKAQRGQSVPANVDAETGEIHETRDQRIDRIVRALSGTLTTSQYNVILREVEGHQLGDDEHIAALIYEAEQRREAARAKQSSGQQQLAKA